MLFDNLIKTMKFIDFDGVFVKILIDAHELKKLQANIKNFFQFLELKIGGEAVKIRLKTEMDVLKTKHESNKDEDLTTE